MGAMYKILMRIEVYSVSAMSFGFALALNTAFGGLALG